MPEFSFRIHDIATFPVVRLSSPISPSGGAFQWCGEMDRILGRRQPFVLIYPSPDDSETAEDRAARGAWLKRQRVTMAAHCLALVIVEPDQGRRERLEEMFPKLQRAFGTPQFATASHDEANSMAMRLLYGDGLLAIGGGAGAQPPEEKPCCCDDVPSPSDPDVTVTGRIRGFFRP